MSAATDNQLKASDCVYTPAWAVDALLAHIGPDSLVPTVMDPFAGDGAILRQVPERVHKIACEVRQSEADANTKTRPTVQTPEARVFRA